MKTIDAKNIDSRLVGTKRLMMLSPIPSPPTTWEECPQADHACSLNTLWLLTSLQDRTHGFEGTSPPVALSAWKNNKSYSFLPHLKFVSTFYLEPEQRLNFANKFLAIHLYTWTPVPTPLGNFLNLVSRGWTTGGGGSQVRIGWMNLADGPWAFKEWWRMRALSQRM